MRATSSVMTAALTAAFADGPIVKTPWFCMSTAGDRESVRVATMPWPIESSPISANGPTGIDPPNSSAIAVITHGIDSPARPRPSRTGCACAPAR